MMSLIQELEKQLIAVSSKENVAPMENYMKNKFNFFGVRSPDRRAAFRSAFDKYGIPEKDNYQKDVLEMMNHPKREMHHCGIDLALKCQKKYSDIKDFDYISQLLATNSWWDTVDTIAPKILGKYILDFPGEREMVLNHFMASDNMWWHRSCLLFQLKYKDKVDYELLFALCDHFKSSNEFFIRKAIGWVLRENAKINPTLVYDYVDQAELSNLSTREANKHRA